MLALALALRVRVRVRIRVRVRVGVRVAFRGWVRVIPALSPIGVIFLQALLSTQSQKATLLELHDVKGLMAAQS